MIFDLTEQEKQAIIFLACVALVGLGVDFLVKVNPGIREFVRVEDRLIRIDLNTVSLEELMHTRGVPKKIAQSIIDYRQANGFFRSLEDLKQVKGIGDCRYSKLEKLFFVR